MLPTITRDSKLFPIILAIFAALPPLAINTYSPAIPLIADYFHVNNSEVLTTFTTYFIGFSLGMLFWGAISDKYGRRNIILIGTIIYVISTILCSTSHDFMMLEWLRFVQGLSDSVGGVIAFSIARDCYKGAKLMSMIATIVSIMLIAPILAPVIGTILTVTTGTWQSTFYFLALYGIVMFTAALMIEETLKDEDKENKLINIIPAYFKHIANLKFLLATLASGAIFAALFIYISSASIVYLEKYQVSPTLYCIYYSIACISSIGGNIIIKRLAGRITDLQYLQYGVLVLSLSCVFLFLSNELGFDSAFVYTLAMCVLCLGVSFCCSILYAYSMNTISENFGTANSVSSFLKNMVAGISSFVISFYHGDAFIRAIPVWQFIFVLAAAVMMIGILQLKRSSKHNC